MWTYGPARAPPPPVKKNSTDEYDGRVLRPTPRRTQGLGRLPRTRSGRPKLLLPPRGSFVDAVAPGRLRPSHERSPPGPRGQDPPTSPLDAVRAEERLASDAVGRLRALVFHTAEGEVVVKKEEQAKHP